MNRNQVKGAAGES